MSHRVQQLRDLLLDNRISGWVRSSWTLRCGSCLSSHCYLSLLLDDLLLLLLLSLCLCKCGLLLVHTRPQAPDIVCGLSGDDLWEGLRGSDGAGIDELGGRLLGVEEGRLDVLRIEVHIIRLEVLAPEIHKVVGWAQAGEVAVVEGVLIDVAVVHVDGQGVGDGTLGQAGLLTVEIIVVTWTAECWLL